MRFLNAHSLPRCSIYLPMRSKPVVEFASRMGLMEIATRISSG